MTASPSMSRDPGEYPRPRKSWLSALTAILCAASIAMVGCSKAKSPAKIVDDPGKDDPKDPNDDEPDDVLSAVDQLVEKNKGKGLGVVTGFLTGEGKTASMAILKQAANAAGERRLLKMETVPLPAAQILIFNALEPTTSPDTSLKTDTAGNYTVVLPEGKYFGFAVYLDLETFSLVTTQIPNIAPVADTVVKMDTAVAIEDETAPTVTSVYDAMAPNSDKIFLVGSIASVNAKVNITFSEPMNRESAKGIVLGRIDTSNTTTSLVLADTVKDVSMTWSGDSKELTLNVKSLDEDAQYGVIIPVACKDLAKNALEAAFGATFVTAKAEDLAKVEFVVSNSFPADGDSVKPIQNPTVSFNRPVDVFTVMKNASISPKVEGFWEVAGARATFIHKEPLKVGEKFTIKLPITIKDLGGNALSKEISFAFSVKDFDGAAKDKSGDEKSVALAVEQMFDAYLQGDIGRFGSYFHPNFRMNEGDRIVSRTQFLDDRRADVAEKQLLSSGYLAPVFDATAEACKERIQRWKVNPEGGSGDPIWAESYTHAGQMPRFWDKDGKEIPKAELQFDASAPRLTYKAKKYGFAPNFNQYSGPVNQDNAKQDLRFMADIMAKTSTLALEPVKVSMKEEFTVDGGLKISGDTAKVAVKMSNEEDYSRTNFDGFRGCDTLGGTHYDILKFLMIRDGSKWVVLNIESSGEDNISKEDFNKNVDMKDFGQTQTQPLTLVAPVNQKENAFNAKAQVEFKWQKVKSDSVKGYIVGIAEDNRFCGNRPPYGALFFVKAEKGDTIGFTLDENAQVVGTHASSILKRAQDLRLPGWERVMFEYVLPKLEDAAKGMAGVYNWKVIAVQDSSAAQFLANGFSPQRFYGESDFGIPRGFFSVKKMPQGASAEVYTNQNNTVQNSGAVGFTDMDQDGYPDFIELKYVTDMRSRDSYPDFRLDTDGDKLPDFLEKMLDKDGSRELVTTKGDEIAISDEMEELKDFNIVIEDTDFDGFPNDIEQLFGFNPNDKNSNPGTRARAEAPVGGFVGKIAMGDARNDLSFKISKDSSGALWSAYKSVIGKDTLVDTVRASFSDLQNSLVFQIILPKDGPNAGKSLWMRGNYDQFQQLLMGPCDLGPSADKKSAMINGGPQAGQWAASGRGEDVSGRLPGPGQTGPANPGQTGPAEISYRLPPAGIVETSSIEFTSDGGVILINEVGDTVAQIDTVMVRRQPNGFEFQATKKTQFANGGKFIDMGGMLVQKATGWVIDGHVFTQIDSGSVHKSVPGQMAFKANAADIVSKGDAEILLIGSLEGWIQQDFSGTGLTGQPTNNQGGDCPAGQTCPPTNNNFGVPFIGGVKGFQDHLAKLGIQMGRPFYVTAGGQVMEVQYDSTSIVPAKAPWCNNVILMGRLLFAADAPEADRKRMEDMQKQMDEGKTLLVVLEEPSRPGNLSVIDKVLDATGVVRTQVISVEARNPPPDYGITTMVCNPAGPANPDPNNPNPNPGPALPGFSGMDTKVKDALTASGYMVVWLDSAKKEVILEVDPGTLARDSGSKFIYVLSKGQPVDRLTFLHADGKPEELAMIGNKPRVERGPTNPGPNPNPNPCPTTEPCTTNPPPDTSGGPVLFSGDLQQVRNLLNNSANKAGLMTGENATPIGVTLNPTSLRLEAGMVLVNDATDDMKIYVVLGEGADPKKPMLRNNQVVVAPQALLAGG